MLQARALRLAVVLAGTAFAAPAPAASVAVVANYRDHTASIVDTGCRPTFPASCTAVLATVPVGTHPYGVAVHPDGTFAYVTNSHDDTVSVIDVPARAVVATLPVGSLPYGVAVATASGTAYVAALAGHSVTVVSADHAVVATLSVPNPHGLAVSPDGRRLYVGDYGSGALTVVDTATLAILAQVPVGGWPVGIAVHPSGSPVFVASFAGRQLVAVDAATLEVVGRADVGAGAAGVALDAAGTTAYVASMDDNSVAVVRTGDMAVVATVPVGSGPLGIAADPDGRSVYVTNVFDDFVSVLDTGSHAIVASLPVGSAPYSHGAFVARVADARSRIVDIQRTLAALALPRGLATPLAQFLRQALAAHDAGAATLACERLARFAAAVRQARTTRRIDAATTTLLLRDAAGAGSGLGCR